jgi:hypothetical protein
MSQHDEIGAATGGEDVLERAAEELRRPARVDAALFDARVMDEVLRPPPTFAGRFAALARPRTISVSPLGALAAALVLAAVVTGAVLYLQPSRSPIAVARDVARTGTDAPIVEFGFVAPHASSVALVGDFNNWDPKATPLHASAAGGVWSVEVPIHPGRHLYAFVVDGTVWRPDPGAPPADGEDFGEPNSALTVADPSVQ